MEENRKAIKLLEKAEFFEKLNEKIKVENYDKFLDIFKKLLKNSSWIDIPNKELYFNKDIMACYSKNKIIHKCTYSTTKNLKEILNEVNSKAEYKKYNICWDVQNIEELKLAIDNNLAPDIYINYGYIFYKDGNFVKVYMSKTETEKNRKSQENNNRISKEFNNNPIIAFAMTLKSAVELQEEKDTALFPIFRLGNKKNQLSSKKGNNKISYTDNEIFNIFLKEELIPKEINNKVGLKNEYEKLIKDYKEKRLKYEDYLINDRLNEEKIIEKTLTNTKNSDSLFNDVPIEITLDNGDVIERTYKNGIPDGFAICYKADKIIDVIEFQYKNGVIEGSGTIYYKNGDKEEIEYKNGVIQGKALYKYSDGAEETRNYVNGKLFGEIIYKKDDIVRVFEIKNNKRIEKTQLYQLLDVDKKRINLDPYDENILFDPNRGHWDLFKNNLKNEVERNFNNKVYARDPRMDIKRGGIVGIDFGTKSTVVVFQDDNTKTMPMRISGVTLNKEIESSDYENPTIVEFKDIENFMKNYTEKNGRPFTNWEDVTVSHTAFQSLLLGSSEQFSSVLSELKQWAGTKNKKIILRDKKGVEKLINPYLELKEEDIDPIEIYAYYIGSYINNMRNGIYLEYYLSFPVNYELEIRNKILNSFEKGIKKSLPEEILNDDKLMRYFKVNSGTSEPAAYAVCALQEYGFEPQDNEKIYYGVFDFGGGTTDFDFGIWKVSEDEESYDYDLEHFGAGGDRYLGGENILKELAYKVFKDNQSTLREKNISFVRPEWCERFMGDELLIDFSQEANLNLRQLAEKLRGIWENSEDKINEDSLKINLFNKKSIPEIGVSLKLDLDKINDIIETKISEGVNNFFNSMERAFRNEDVEKINIFLAGNSCKHNFVKKAFEKEIEKRKISAEIFSPLGTKEAYDKIRKKGIKIDENDSSKPTGKTGVAYGILETVSEGRINIIDKNLNSLGDNDIKFKYYIGDERRKKLKCFLTPETNFDSFISFTTLKTSAFNIYFTTSSEAVSNKLSIDEAKRKRVILKNECEKGAKIYIKIISPSKIAYAVTLDDILDKNFLEVGEVELD